MTSTQRLIIIGLLALTAFCLFMAIRESKRQGAKQVDNPYVVAEVNNYELPNIGDDIEHALKTHKDCKWAEARGKKGDPNTLEIVCHTTAKK